MLLVIRTVVTITALVTLYFGVTAAQKAEYDNCVKAKQEKPQLKCEDLKKEKVGYAP